ncbi:TIGR02466 family protein [Rhodanobacter sp. B04]|uniref:TIGR02466 family protein n=1 Tax=Rhodanobacter sp. B04 TaxID=1945860 RepID=UPI0009849C98|nr:TIGR02466 family protein [Rhodanobacter sp. B04]
MAGNSSFPSKGSHSGNQAGFTVSSSAPGSISYSVATPTVAPALRSFDLFPTRIWQAQMPALTTHLQEWASTVLALRAASPRPAGRTNRQGWNSEDMAVLEQPVFAPLRQAIRSGCTSALSEMGVRDVPFQLQSWINLHDRGGFNFLHVHEGCLLSGCFYLKVPAGSGKLVFRDPRPGVIHGYVKGAVPNGYSDIQLTPDAGLLVLFPSWMEHFVEPHDSDEPRISISFNAVTA